MTEQLVDIKLYADALQEALTVYLSNSGLRVTDKTEVFLMEDPARGVYAEVKNLALSPVQLKTQVAPAPTQPSPKQIGRELGDALNAGSTPPPPPAPSSKPKMVKMVDASAYEEGKLEETKTFEVPASRYAVEPVPKGDPPRMRGGVLEITRPTDTNAGVDERFHTQPVEGLKPSVVVSGERGRLADMPDQLDS